MRPAREEEHIQELLGYAEAGMGRGIPVFGVTGLANVSVSQHSGQRQPTATCPFL